MICRVCRTREADYTCVACAGPLCDACAKEAPEWRFVCQDCEVPADPRKDPWEPEDPGW